MNWPYEVERIELWNYNEKFKKSLPASGSSPAVCRGFELFQKYCVACHSVYREGGRKGGELMTWLGVRAHDDNWLKAWIANPRVINSKSKMPPLNPQLRNREAEIDNIVAYLREMSSNPAH